MTIDISKLLRLWIKLFTLHALQKIDLFLRIDSDGQRYFKM